MYVAPPFFFFLEEKVKADISLADKHIMSTSRDSAVKTPFMHLPLRHTIISERETTYSSL